MNSQMVTAAVIRHSKATRPFPGIQVQRVGEIGGFGPAQREAYALDMKYRARHRIPGGPTSPYPLALRNLVTAVNTVETIAALQQDLIRASRRLQAKVGRLGGMSPEEFRAADTAIKFRLYQLGTLKRLIQTRELPAPLIDDVAKKVALVGKLGGLGPEELDAYVLDMAFRAKHRIPGPPGSAYPNDKAHLIQSIIGVERAAEAKGALQRDLKAKSAGVGRAGGLSPEEFASYSADIHHRLATVQQAQDLFSRFELPSAMAKDLSAKIGAIGKAGGLSPREFTRYLRDIHHQASRVSRQGVFPAAGFHAVR